MTSDPTEEFNRFKALIEAAGMSKFGVPFIRVFCVVGKGYWYFAEQELHGEKARGWWRSGTCGSHPEFVALVAGVLNSIRSEKQRRYGLPFGYYLIDDGLPVFQGP
jgi:hypothetical protein